MLNFGEIGPTAAKISRFIDFSRWRPTPSWILEILTVGTFSKVYLRLRAKCCRNRLNRGWDMAIFRIFKMAAVRHLGFLKVGNFNFRSHSEAQYASPYQISRRSVEPFRRYSRFSIFQDGGCPPSWIGFTRVGTTHEEYLVVFVTVQNLVVIGAVISIVCKF